MLNFSGWNWLYFNSENRCTDAVFGKCSTHVGETEVQFIFLGAALAKKGLISLKLPSKSWLWQFLYASRLGEFTLHLEYRLDRKNYPNKLTLNGNRLKPQKYQTKRNKKNFMGLI